MRDSTQRTLAMGQRVEDFNTENAASIPAGSRAGQLVMDISTAVQTLEEQGAAQDAAVTSGLEATTRKNAAVAALRQLLRPLSEIADGMESLSRGVSERFKIPRGSHQTLLNRAHAVHDEAATMTAQFTDRGLPATFLTDLQASITAVERARDAQNQARSDEVTATAAIAAAEQQLKAAVRELSPIMRTIFRSDAAKLAAWESASRIERASRRKKETPASPPA